MLSAEIIRVLREDHAEADKNLFKHFDPVLFSVCSPSLVQLLTICMLCCLYMLTM